MQRHLLILLLLPCFSFGQNLVPNYSFEDTLECPDGIGGINDAVGWFRPPASTGSSDLFHSCSVVWGVPTNGFGTQTARTGEAYAGAILLQGISDQREYTETELTSPLKKDSVYCIEFFVALAGSSEYAIDKIGLHLSNDTLQYPTANPYPVQPQIYNQDNNIITGGWVSISGNYKAMGGERFITIGNFYLDVNTAVTNVGGPFAMAYYYIDDVSVYLVEEITLNRAGKDTTICLGDNPTIGQPEQQGYVYSWQPAAGISDTTAAQPSVTPTQTTSYILYVEDTTAKPYTCKTEAWDTVTVTVINCDTFGNTIWLPNIFSPNGDGNNDVLYVRGSNIADIAFTIFNRWGQQVFNSTTIDAGWAGTYLNEPLNDGVFAYRVTGTYKAGTSFAIKGNVTLVR